MRTTTDTLTGKPFLWNTVVSVGGVTVPARETKSGVTHLHPQRVPADLLAELNSLTQADPDETGGS